MQILLTGKKRLPGFTEEWTNLNMAEKSTLKARIGWQGLTTAEYLESGQYLLVTGTDFQNGRINWSSCWFVDKSRYMQDTNILLKPKDVLLTKDGTIGKVGYVDSLPRPATLNSGVFVIRPKNNAYNPLYFYYVLDSHIFSNFLAKLQAGSTISHLYQKDFVNFNFMAPEIEEQSAIASILSDMDTEIDELEHKLAKYKLIKQGMMQELLTGKKRLV
jgi:type I restriction enzyme S subunit